MEKINGIKKIFTTSSPRPIGPYSQAIRVGSLLFMSGQIPINPQTGEIPSDIEAQAIQVMKNMEAILKEAGLNFSHVVKTTIFLTDLSHFEKINRIYAQFVSSDVPPARSTVEVSKLPKGVSVEIEGVASYES